MKSLLIRLIKKLGDMRRHLLYYRIWPAVYRHAAKKPIDEKKVLLASNSKTLPDNLSCMKPVSYTHLTLPTKLEV